MLQILQRSSLDPHALKDPFLLLSEREQLSYWGDDDGKTFEERRRGLDEFVDMVYVDVVLVGFEGDSHLALEIPTVGVCACSASLRLRSRARLNSLKCLMPWSRMDWPPLCTTVPTVLWYFVGAVLLQPLMYAARRVRIWWCGRNITSRSTRRPRESLQI